MYCEYFGLHEKPFNMTPDPRFLFLSQSHREALAHVIYGIDNRAGFIELTGEVGAGKTTVMRALLAQLDPERYRTALIFNPCLSAPDLLKAINREFHILSEGISRSELLERLYRFLIRQDEEGRIVVLVIDEAQNLQPDVLEQIRLISNLETDRKKLLQIILVGQPELGQLLERKDLRQINQRIVVRYHLCPMKGHDTCLYIQHRLIVAGAKGRITFSKGAAKMIFRYSGGLPRLINIACDRALLAAYTRNTRQIDTRIASAGIADVKRGRAALNWKLCVGTVTAMGIIATAFIFSLGENVVERFTPATPIEGTKSVRVKIAPPQALSQNIRTALEEKAEQASAGSAVASLAKVWKITPPDGTVDLNDPRAVERAAREAGLSPYWFSGNLGALLRLDCPAILELRLPGGSGKRYLALTGVKDGRILVDPPLADRATIAPVDLEPYWSGRGLILWRNSLDLPTKILPGSSGKHVRELQGLLAQAGVFHGPITGRYDGKTVSAIRDFQSSKGIELDGIPGEQTLILLYRAAGRFETPGLLR